MFAVTAGLGIEKTKNASRRSRRLLVHHVQIAGRQPGRSFAEYMHERMRTDLWGYAPASAQQRRHDHREIRRHPPGARLPGLPRAHGKARNVQRVAGRRNRHAVDRIFAMFPGAAVSGFYFAHPESKYFIVGKIGIDQVEDMVKRRACRRKTSNAGWRRTVMSSWAARGTFARRQPLSCMRRPGAPAFRGGIMATKFKLKRWQDQIILLLGLWLIVSPWVLPTRVAADDQRPRLRAGDRRAGRLQPVQDYFCAVMIRLAGGRLGGRFAMGIAAGGSGRGAVERADRQHGRGRAGAVGAAHRSRAARRWPARPHETKHPARRAGRGVFEQLSYSA